LHEVIALEGVVVCMGANTDNMAALCRTTQMEVVVAVKYICIWKWKKMGLQVESEDKEWWIP